MEQTCGARIKQRLSELNMSQSELAVKTSISKATLSQYINGKYRPTQERVEILSNALDVSPAWLMGYDVPKKEFDALYNLIKEDKRLQGAIKKYFKLDNVGQAMILAYIDAQYDSRNGEETVEEMLEKCVVPGDAVND